MNQYFSKRQEFSAYIEREAFEGLTDSVLRQGLEFVTFFDVDEHLSLEEKDALHGLKARASRHVQERLEMALPRVLSIGCLRELYVAAESDEIFDALYRRAYECFVEYVNMNSSSLPDDESPDDGSDDDGSPDEE